MHMLKPKIKSVHAPFTLPGNRIIIGLMQYGVASEIQDDETGMVARMLTLMDGSRSFEQIHEELSVTHPGLDRDSVREVIQQLIEQGFVEDAAAPPPGELSPRELSRYDSARNFFAWIDTSPRQSPYEPQRRLKQAKVGLLGLGGTGSAVATGLVASGIGRLHCVDFDTVEEGNLTRQLLYTEADVGRSKVTTAVERLRALNSNVNVTGEECKVASAEDVVRLMDGCDVFVLCADRPENLIEEWTNEAALRTRTPWYVSFYTGPMAVVRSFVPSETGCYVCLQRQEGQREINRDKTWLTERRPNAVIAASANISGHLCALDVIYQLTGMPQQARGRAFHHNFANWDHHYYIDAVRDPDCPACGETTGRD
ncbi:Molybdopterin or thiamine biosynthesis adenylyltransferase [Micromonospora coriariae]|uniref:Molybdopterin or thiamine biosynthesis adenylyltransferase n=1 Tax=Micromonospora coriariae TaxID=285665 RepID=A0A1C4VPL0_9ACTN|nr:ThiF family adenylyltransferase [Micromonospora coriariae]SCE85751.1 Molybdopterin or thiamine biosynthesis adenylyltransferase [Micromonospora coriariae]